MITIIEQPDFWESAYRPVLVKFKNLIVGGGSTLFVQNSIAQPTKRFVGFEPFSRFAKLGDNIEFIETGGSLQVGKVIGFETVGGDYGCIVNLPSISGSSSYTLTYVAIRQQARVDLILKTGSVYSELNKTIALASTPSIDGIHSVDLGGFLQNSFNPITAICDGVDQPMFTHYELYQKINSTDSALLFP